MAAVETCLWHASDWIAWIDRSGDARPTQEPLVDVTLAVNFRIIGDINNRGQTTVSDRGQTTVSAILTRHK